MVRTLLLHLFVILSATASIAQVYNNPGGTINTCSGTFHDSGGAAGNYADNEFVVTTFCSNSPGDEIIVDFSSYDIENFYDNLNVYDGPTTASPLLGSLSGTGSATFFSSSGCLTFEFSSDFSVTQSGWTATISCGPPPTIYTASGGTITDCSGLLLDNGGTGPYGNNENITTTICSSSPGDEIILDFTSYDIESGWDFLYIHDGPSTASPLITTLTGTGSTLVSSSSGCLTLQFVSDGSVTSAGWQAEISCGTPPPIVPATGGTITTCSGILTDAGGFGNYANNENITTTVCPDVAGECVTLDFTTFDIEGLNYDELSIFDGPSAGSPLIGTYTGTSGPGTVTASSGCLTLLFTSDFSVTAPGWTADISCGPCPGSGPCTGTTVSCSPVPDDCSIPCSLPALSLAPPCPGGGTVVDEFCLSNIGATAESPYTFLVDCQGIPGNDMSSPAADVWYSFTATGTSMNISVSGLDTPNVAIYQGVDCSAFALNCDVSTTGLLNTSVNGLFVGVDYLIRISGGSPADVSDSIRLDLTSFNDCANCLISTGLTVNPSPVSGTYQPGEVVEFCFTVTEWNAASINWFHGIEPILGPGWDASTLTPTSAAASIDGFGTWDWYPSVTSTNTGLTFGPGFFYETGGDGNPGNNFGDNGTGGWTFCWEVEVGACPPNASGTSLNMEVETYGDSESGSWTSTGCTGDAIYSFSAVVSCCDPPILTGTDATCFGVCDGEIVTTAGSPAGPFRYVYEDASGTIVRDTVRAADQDTFRTACASTFTVRVTDNTGCIDSSTVVIGEPLALTGTFDTTVCAGETFVFNGTTYGGTNLNGTETLIASDGCDSVVTVTVTESPVFTLADAITGCDSAPRAGDLGGQHRHCRRHVCHRRWV